MIIVKNYSVESIPDPDARQRRITRLLLLVWLGLGLIVVALLCFIVSQAFRPIPIVPIAVGTLDEYPAGSVNLEFINGRFFDELANKELETIPLQVVRDENGNFTVFFARSTRQSEAILAPRACIVEWDNSIQQFLELCAGSRWARDGTYQGGPAPRNLDKFPARVENGTLFVELQLEKGAPRP